MRSASDRDGGGSLDFRQSHGRINFLDSGQVPTGEQDPLIEFLTAAAHEASTIDGWLSASLHKSLDGTRVVNYAQSANRDAARRVFEHLSAKGMIDGNKRFGEAHPGLYRVALTIER